MAHCKSQSKENGADEKSYLKLEDFEIDFFDDESEKEETNKQRKSIKDFISDSVSLTSNSLLRATICELERALSDTRRLLFERDKENSVLRQDLEKSRKDLHKENQARKKLEVEKESQNEKVKKEENEKSKLRQEIEELKEKLLEFEETTESADCDEIVPCCSSMHELLELRRKLNETEKQLEDSDILFLCYQISREGSLKSKPPRLMESPSEGRNHSPPNKRHPVSRGFLDSTTKKRLCRNHVFIEHGQAVSHLS